MIGYYKKTTLDAARSTFARGDKRVTGLLLEVV